jgi:hypothetical protein
MKSEIKVITLQSEKNREGKLFFYKERGRQTHSTTTRFRIREIKNKYYNLESHDRGWLSFMNKIPSYLFDYYSYDKR